MRRLLREPLLHFLLTGAALFLLYSLKNRGAAAPEEPEKITVGAAQLEPLVAGFTRTWKRPPNPAELEGLVADFLKEEVLYREALAMGLAKNDTIIRRRMAQKMEFLTGDVATLTSPDEAALATWFESHAAQYAGPPLTGFTHVYYSREKRRDRTEADAGAGLAVLAQHPEQAGEMGDPSLLPVSFGATPLQDIQSQFGSGFAEALLKLPLNEWQGPVASSYGLHLVKVTVRTGPVRADLATVRETVLRDYLSEQREALNRQTLEELKKRYRITVDRASLHRMATGAATDSAP